MKHLKLSLVTFAILISGCGGGNSSSSTPDSPTGSGAGDSHETKTVAEAEKNINVLSSFSTLELSPTSVTSDKAKSLNKFLANKITNQKEVVRSCSEGGTVTINISDDEKRIHYSFKNCKNDHSLMNGAMTIVQTDSENIELTYDKLTIKDEDGRQYMNLTMKINEDSSTQIDTIAIDGVVNQTLKSGEKNNIAFTNFVEKNRDTASESWSTIDGTVDVESKCTTGRYTFKTIEKLVDATDGSDNIESGILKLNGATYTFENPYVTIKAGSEEETIKQSELAKRMSNACDI